MLGVLRRHSDGAPLQPQPGLKQLSLLIEQARAAGLGVRLVVDGEPVPLPPGLSIAAYRIVQESLTNVVKHAPGAPAVATIRYRPASLEIDVVDSGAHAPVAGRAG